MKNAHFKWWIPAFATLLIAGCGGGGDDDDGGSPPPPAAISAVQMVSGNNQNGTAGAELAAPIVGKIVDASGNALAGRVLTFRVKSGGGELFMPSATSDASGLISNRWTLGPGTGAQQVEIRGDAGASGGTVYATFDATSVAGAPSKILSVTGDGQARQQVSTLPVPLTATVTDNYGNAVSGVTVTFTPCAQCGSANPTTAVTNGAGVASTVWTLGVPIGTQRLAASVGGTSLWSYAATATEAPPGAAVSILAYLGSGQTITQHQQNSQPFVVVVYDALGNEVPGAEVDFEPAPGSGFFTPATLTTRFDGGAFFTTYFHTAGSQRVQASVPGVSTPAVFDIEVLASPQDLDGTYDCTLYDGLDFFLKVTNGVVSGQEHNDPGHGLSNVSPNPLAADGQFTGTWRVSLDYRAVVAGTFAVGPNDTATASGTWLEYFSGNIPPPGTPPDGTWSCVRQ